MIDKTDNNETFLSNIVISNEATLHLSDMLTWGLRIRDSPKLNAFHALRFVETPILFRWDSQLALLLIAKTTRLAYLKYTRVFQKVN